MDQVRIDLLKHAGFSDKAIQYIMNQVNLGEMETPTITTKNQGKCGDILILYLDIKDEIIKDARYHYIGCSGLHAAAAGMTEMIKGYSLNDAEKLSIEDIINYLEGIPKEKYDCAELAHNTLKKALKSLVS